MLSALLDSLIFFRSVLGNHRERERNKFIKSVHTVSRFLAAQLYCHSVRIKVTGGNVTAELPCCMSLITITTYSPVENIPTVNTMQAHDRRSNKSIEREKSPLQQPVCTSFYE